MGNRGRKKRGNLKRAKKDDGAKVDDRDNNKRTDNYKQIVETENANFEEYYKSQNFVPEGEWDDFMAALKRPLPIAFRVTGTRKHAECLQKILENDIFPPIKGLVVDEKEVPYPTALQWYPGQLAYQQAVARHIVRRTPELKVFHRFLVNEAEKGNISRQEAVSMIPPLMLDVHPGHKVLDLCAAPGSKTCQIIEQLDGEDENHPLETIPDGLVVANDVDNKRCYLLVHHCKRLRSPRMVITNQDAALFPTLYESEDKTKPIKYDRILCDVPCSGDGTMRKNITVWQKWSPSGGNSLHSLQLRILKRGLQMLEESGLLCYSTCSFSPVENEAVVATILNEFDGAVELVDLSEKLPHLKRIPGLSSWTVGHVPKGENTLAIYNSFAECPDNVQQNLRKTMFPPENAKDLNLDRCIRMLPHHQDTGGFFICAFRKVKQTQQDEAVIEQATEEKKPAHPKGERSGPKNERGFKEDPFVFFQKDDPLIQLLKTRFSIKDSFPFENLFVRNVERPRSLYLTSPSIRTTLQQNEKSVKFINSGVRIFSKCDLTKDETSGFRLVQEGLHLITPFLNDRVVKMCFDDAVLLLSKKDLKMSDLTPETQERVLSMGGGSLCGIMDPNDPISGAKEANCLSSEITYLSLWSGREFVKLMLDPQDTLSSLMFLVGPHRATEETEKYKTLKSEQMAARAEKEKEKNDQIIAENAEVFEESKAEKRSPENEDGTAIAE